MLIAAGLKKLICVKSLDAISVSEIAKYCHVSRNTFYYYFKDKNDAVEWIIGTETNALLNSMVEECSCREVLMGLCQYFQENRQFYQNVLLAENRGGPFTSFVSCCKMVMLRAINATEKAKAMSNEKKRFFSQLYSYALVGAAVDWFNNAANPDPTGFVQLVGNVLLEGYVA